MRCGQLAMLVLLVVAALPRSGSSAAPAQDDGIPIDNEVVVRSCVTCHAMDDAGRMSRISYRRTTPEGWQQTIRRMVTLNDVVMEPDDAREILRYLSNEFGLAPEEARPGAFEVERRLVEHDYPHDVTEATCIPCHSMGRIINQRRTLEEWQLVIEMHRGYYPLSDFFGFRRLGRRQTTADGPADDDRHPMDKAIEHLAEVFPLETPEWEAWSATMRAPKLAGTWSLSGHHPGYGPVFGEVVIDADPDAEDRFSTRSRFVYAKSGRTVRRNGRALIYTGFQWRGRSDGSGDADELHEVMWVERDWRGISGRWYTGAYEELGLDVTLQRAAGQPIVSGTYPQALRTGSGSQTLTIYGADLPTTLSPQEIDLGQGVEVTRVVSASADTATVELAITADASIGARDLVFAGVVAPEAVTVYDSIDAIKVSPQAGMARVGGGLAPKQYEQFEATAYSRGADGEIGTDDDLDLGAADVNWSLEEYSATFDDDDIEFVGSIDGRGLFDPSIDGPNPQRSGDRNNVGDVWVVAELEPNESTGAIRQLRARAHLLVSVPVYLRWGPWEVSP